MDDSVQCWSNPRIEYFKIWHSNSSFRTRRFEIIHWFNHLHFFDPQHNFHGKLWASTYLSLESNLPASKRGWCGEFVTMRIWNMQSLLVCSIILWKSHHTRVEWISGWRSWLASRIQGCVWCLAFTRYMRWCVFWYIRDPRIWRGWGAEEDAVGFAKTFPDVPCVSQLSGGLSLRLGTPTERHSIPPGFW